MPGLPPPPSDLYGAPPRIVAQLGHSAGIRCVALSRDGKLAITGGATDQIAVLWEVETGLELRRFPSRRSEAPGNVVSVAFSPGAEIVVAGLDTGAVEVWSVASGNTELSIPGPAKGAGCVAVSPDGEIGLRGGEGGVLLFNARNGGPRIEFGGHEGRVEGAVFSPDGRWVATSDQRRTTIVWSVETGEERFRVEKKARRACFLPDGRLVTVGAGEGWVWSSEGEPRAQLQGCESGVEALGWSPEDPVLTGDAESISSWDADSGARLTRVPSHDLFYSPQCFSADGRYLFVGFMASPFALLWDVAKGVEVERFEGKASWVAAMALSPDGRTLAAASLGLARDTPESPGSGRVGMWNLETGQEERRFRYEDVTGLGFRRQGETLLVSDTQFTYLVDALSGVELARYRGHLGQGEGPAAGGSERVATRGFREVLLWDGVNGEPIAELGLEGVEVRNVALSADGRTAAAWAAGRVHVWDVPSRRGRWQLDVAGIAEDGESRFLALALSADGRVVFAGHQLWSTATGELVASLDQLPHAVSSAAFSTDGRRLVTGDFDHRVRLWEVETGRLAAEVGSHWDAVSTVGFSPDEKRILSAGVDGTLRLWDLASCTELAKLISFDDGSWAVVDDEGRFDGSNGGDLKGLHWVVAGQTVALAQLKERYYDPGLLAKHLGLAGEPLREVRGFNQLGLELYPKVELLESPTPERPLLRFRLENCGGGIGRAAVLINGKEAVYDARPEPLRAQPHTSEPVEIEVDLGQNPLMVPGADNRLMVIAHNVAGHLASRGSVSIGQSVAEVDPEPPQLWALVVGISNYSGVALDLAFAAKDARDFAAALTLAGEELFDRERVHVTVLTDEQATRAGWEAAIEPLTAAKPGDVLVVFFAGHGLTVGGADGDYYYLLSEATSFDLSDPAVRGQVAISGEQVTEAIKRVPALKQVLILDTCASGQLITDISSGRAVSSSQARSLERLKDRTGMFVLAGSAADSVSYETTRFGQGLLTYSLLLGMKGAALRDDEFVDVSTWFGHAVERVPELARGIGGIQQPRLAVPRGGESFDVGSSPAAVREQIVLAEEKPVLVRASFQDERRVDDHLDLSGQVTEALRAAAVGEEPPFVFVDARRFPGSYRVAGRYAIDGLAITVRALLVGGDREPVELKVEGATTELAELARLLSAEVGSGLKSPA